MHVSDLTFDPLQFDPWVMNDIKCIFCHAKSVTRITPIEFELNPRMLIT